MRLGIPRNSKFLLSLVKRRGAVEIRLVLCVGGLEPIPGTKDQTKNQGGVLAIQVIAVSSWEEKVVLKSQFFLLCGGTPRCEMLFNIVTKTLCCGTTFNLASLTTPSFGEDVVQNLPRNEGLFTSAAMASLTTPPFHRRNLAGHNHLLYISGEVVLVISKQSC